LIVASPSARRARRPLQVFRVASLVLPTALAWEVASMTLHRTSLDGALAHTLGPLWLATMGALVVRGIDARVRRVGRQDRVPWYDAIDVLTATGSSVAWTGALAVLGSVSIGWASLSLVGLFGLCVLHVVALWTLLRAGGDDPWRRASLSRGFGAATLVEGEAVTEEVRLAGPRIPAGFRLFASGRVGPRWPTSRYVVDASDCGGEVILESDLGPAVRGTHDAEPLEVWLQDVLGLCHSPRVAEGAARLTVLPAPAYVEGSRQLLDLGGHDDEPRPASRLPTQGSLGLREYQIGDDVRRIHWLRSLTAQQIVVRLPDELPPDQPAVRLVLDTFHHELAPTSEPLTCRAPDELLDGLVRVWLGIGRELVARGVRVTAIATVSQDGETAPLRRPLHRRALAQVQRLGARVEWQRVVRPEDLLDDGPSIVVSHRLPTSDAESAARWVVVPGVLWTAKPGPEVQQSTLVLPHPAGSADNRRSRRSHASAERRRERADWDAFRWLCEHSQTRRVGHLVARPVAPLQVQLELLR
jgi:hypothetical protein